MAVRDTVGVAILGCGNVGGALAERLLTGADEIARRTGLDLELVGVAVQDLDKPRTADVPASLLTDDAKELVERDGVDIVVELIGGIEPARTLVEAALRAGQAGGDRQQGAAGRVRRRAGRPGGGQRGGPALRGGGRRRHPGHPAPARVAGRRADRPGDGHRERDHQLHPDPDDRRGARLRRGPGRGPAPRPGRAGPHGRRGGRRRRGQGGHPGRPGLRERPGGRQPSTARASPGCGPSTSPSPGGWATW